MDLQSLPSGVRALIDNLPYTVDSTGMSGSRVLVFPEAVLKIGPLNVLTDGMVRLMRWLEGRLPVPRVLHFERDAKTEYLLMTRMPGRMACDPKYLEQPETLLHLLAEALHMLWDVEVAGCPQRRSLEGELAHARRSLEAGIVDFSGAEPDTFGPGGFESPEKLLRWLEDNRPPLETAFSHGDCCLPNIFFQGDRVSGFIDLGDAGVADRWRDLALCYRSLKHNTNGFHGYTVPGFRPERLFDALGIRPDWDKLRYYILLDEFF